jgi:hypothetical protein
MNDINDDLLDMLCPDIVYYGTDMGENQLKHLGQAIGRLAYSFVL